jgi:hypothetical protein
MSAQYGQPCILDDASTMLGLTHLTAAELILADRGSADATATVKSAR